ARWRGYRHNWQRSAELAAEAEALLAQLADLDLCGIKHSLQADAPSLDCTALRRLDVSRQRNILRRWLQRSGIPEPGYHLLQQIVGEVVTAGADAQPQVSWRAGQQTLVLRRHAELLQVLTAPVDPVAIDAEIDLLPGQTLTLPGNG